MMEAESNSSSSGTEINFLSNWETPLAPSNDSNAEVAATGADESGDVVNNNQFTKSKEYVSSVGLLLEEGYTQLSEDLFMYNKEPLRKGTKIYQGYQLHAHGHRRWLAVKLISPYEDKNASEVKHLLKLSNHPNVVQIFQSKERQGTARELYIAMELCDLQNLEDYLNEKYEKNVPFDFKETLTLSKQIIAGMKHIHDSDIVHGDVKPANVLFSSSGKLVKLADFGVSKDLRPGRSRATVTNAGIGTQGYRAPEMFSENVITRSADIFSLGVTISRLFSHGKHPFGEDLLLQDYNIVNNKGRDYSGLLLTGTKRDEFVDLIDKMLQPDPKKRPTIEEVYAHRFFNSETPQNHDGSVIKITTEIRGLPEIRDLHILGMNNTHDHRQYSASAGQIRLPESSASSAVSGDQMDNSSLLTLKRSLAASSELPHLCSSTAGQQYNVLAEQTRLPDSSAGDEVDNSSWTTGRALSDSSSEKVLGASPTLVSCALSDSSSEKVLGASPTLISCALSVSSLEKVLGASPTLVSSESSTAPKSTRYKTSSGMVPPMKKSRVRVIQITREVIIFSDYKSKHLQLFDPVCKTLKQMHSLHKNIAEKNYSLVTLDDYIYALLPNRSVYRLEYFDEKAIWERMSDMRRNHGWTPAVVVSGFIYAVGGGHPTETSIVERYNPSSDEWCVATKKKISTLNNTAAAAGGLIYSIGGNSQARARSEVEKFDPASSEWTFVASMNEPREGPAASEFNGSIYVVGGNNGRRLSSVECFIPQENIWFKVKEILEPCSLSDALIVNRNIFVIGGLEQYQSVQRYSTEQDVWETVKLRTDQEIHIVASTKAKIKLSFRRR